MKYLFFIAILPCLASAEILKDCGQYSARGIVRAKESGLVVVVNEKTKSQYVLTAPVHQQAVLGAFIDRDVTVMALVDTSFTDQNIAVTRFLKTEARIPDPLNPAGTGFTLIKKMDCKKI